MDGSATEMSKLFTQKKAGFWDRAVLEGVPELVMLWEVTPISAPKWRCRVYLGVEVQPGPGDRHIALCLGHLLPRANQTWLRPDAPVHVLRFPSSGGADWWPWGEGGLSRRLKLRPASLYSEVSGQPAFPSAAFFHMQ